MASLDFLKTTKMPFPEFPFDVLIDDLPYHAGELETLGFGRRWIESPRTAAGTLTALEAYFERDPPRAEPAVRDWLGKEGKLRIAQVSGDRGVS